MDYSGAGVTGGAFPDNQSRQAQTSDTNQDDLEEEHESLWSWGGFKSDIILFFKMLFQRFKRKAKPVTADVTLNWQPEEDIKRRLSIREIYQHLLWQGAVLESHGKIMKRRLNMPDVWEPSRRIAENH